MSRKSILVTGATGFIAQHSLLPLVERGYEVYAVARDISTIPSGVRPIADDLFDRNNHKQWMNDLKPTHLLHTAWITEHGKFWEAPENKDWLDVSIDLFDTFQKNGGQRIIGLGSCAEYDWQHTGIIPWSEDTPIRPATFYGQTKHQLATRLQEMGISYAWARLFFMFGPGEPKAKLVASIIASLLDNQEAKCSSGKQIRDFMDSRDIGEALAALTDSDIEGPVNIASGKAISIAELAIMIGQIIGKPQLIRLGALPDRAGEAPYIVADTSKFLKAVSIHFPSLEQRLQETVDRVRDEVMLP